jgi:energy-coupling factor transport system ATP-binding protein
VLDEPASQLDPDGAREILALIRDLRVRKGLTVVMATNDAGEAAEFADRICVLKNGCLVACDSPQKIVTTESQRITRIDTNRKEGLCLQIEHLFYQYHSDNMILNDVNLVIEENDFMVIRGRNGCGKTTLLKNISGLVRPLRGSIALRGRDTARMSVAEIAGEIGFVMQESDRQLFESTVYDEVAFALKRTMKGRKNEIRGKVEEALSVVGLLDKRDHFPLVLNRADRVKTVFAGVLAMGPRIIMLDEPFAGQDMRGCRLIADILSDLHQKGYTILVITHNINAVAEHARRIVVMQDGAVTA